MLGRKTKGAIVCRSCSRLVGADERKCPYCGAARPSLWGFAPALTQLTNVVDVSNLILVACGFLYVTSLAIDFEGVRGLLGPSGISLAKLGMSGGYLVFDLGRWWTILSAGWLHGGLIHILFNMNALRQLGPPVVEFYGTARMVVIYVVSSACGFALSSLMSRVEFLPPMLQGSDRTVGASAAILGLLAALIHYGKRSGQTRLSNQLWGSVALLVALSLIGLPIDNWAHAGGFGAGWVCARVMDPLKPEKPTHAVFAILCILATLASLVASVLVPLPLPQ